MTLGLGAVVELRDEKGCEMMRRAPNLDFAPWAGKRLRWLVGWAR